MTIVIGINRKIRLFNQENPLKYHMSYFKRFPSLKPKNIVLNISDCIHASSTANATIIRGIRKPDQTFVDITRFIDEELGQINQQISNTRTELQDQINGLTKQLNDQRQQIDSNINDLDVKLVLSNTSDISLELFGAASIGAGLIFSILPLF
jgi:hypothetical protein